MHYYGVATKVANGVGSDGKVQHTTTWTDVDLGKIKHINARFGIEPPSGFALAHKIATAGREGDLEFLGQYSLH